MSSSDLETGIAQQVIQKKTKKTKKGTSKPTAAPTHDDPPAGKNEGDDPNWAYKPPDGAVLLDHTVDVGPFEWDALKDDSDTEIWLIRVPDSIQPKHLQGLEIDLPSSSSPSRTARIGNLTRKTTSYDVWTIGSSAADTDVDANANVAFHGAEELLGLTPLFPRKRQRGKLYIAPKRVAHHIVVSGCPSIATPPGPMDQPEAHRNPPRASYPKDMLTHTFVPYGARSTRTQSEDVSMNAEAEIRTMEDMVTRISDAVPCSEKKKPKAKEHKKRKVEEEAHKRSKKHKAKA